VLVSRIRLLLAELPPLLRAIVENAIGAEADLQLVTDADPREPPDVVVIAAARGEQMAVLRQIIESSPRTRILVITLDNGHAHLIELGPHVLELGALSPDGVARAIRGSRAQGAAP
jgi:DNA-binding NarL/FixJ family response regulator